MKKLRVFAVPLALCAAQGIASAQSIVPNRAFYFGLGGSVNTTDFNNQSIEATGLSDAYNKTTGAYMSSGTAGGPPVTLGMGSQTGFAPVLQAGYFEHFQSSQWLWGAKFGYNGLGQSSTTNPFLIPQYGSYGTTPFTGNAVVQSFKTHIAHQFSLIPFIGHSFEKGLFMPVRAPRFPKLIPILIT